MFLHSNSPSLSSTCSFPATIISKQSVSIQDSIMYHTFFPAITISSHDSLSCTCFFTYTSIYLEPVWSHSSQIHDPASPSRLSLLPVRIPKVLHVPSQSLPYPCSLSEVSLEYISSQNSLSPHISPPRNGTLSLSLFLPYFLDSVSAQGVYISQKSTLARIPYTVHASSQTLIISYSPFPVISP
jgi:hypothetical protein